MTIDQHSPYSEWDKYSSYTREYTGYMALHAGETEEPGSAWSCDKELRLKQVLPEDVPSTCGIANKTVILAISAGTFPTIFSDVFLARLSDGEGRKHFW